MKLYKIGLVIVALALLNSCSKDDDPSNTYAKPNWTLASANQLPNSLTAIVSIPSNLNIYGTDEDMAAAFIDDECRGIGSLVVNESSDKRVFYLTIRGSSIENQKITFRYYNARLSYLYQATNIVYFDSDANYGTYDEPVELDLFQQ